MTVFGLRGFNTLTVEQIMLAARPWMAGFLTMSASLDVHDASIHQPSLSPRSLSAI